MTLWGNLLLVVPVVGAIFVFATIKLSKWLKVFMLGLGACGFLAISVFAFQTEMVYLRRGEQAQIDPDATISAEPSSGGKKPVYVAHMSYVDRNGKTNAFQRLVNESMVARIQRREPIVVEYVPGEWNMERFPGEDVSPATLLVLSLGFAAGLIYVLRKPSPLE